MLFVIQLSDLLAASLTESTFAVSESSLSGTPSGWLSIQAKRLAIQMIFERHDIFRGSVWAICKHFDYDITVVCFDAVLVDTPITLSIRIIGAIVSLHVLISNSCKERHLSILDCVDMDFRAGEIGRISTTVDGYDGVLMPIACHICINDTFVVNSKIDILILEFAITNANYLSDTLTPIFL